MPKITLGKAEYQWEGRSPPPSPDPATREGQRAALMALQEDVARVARGARRALPEAGQQKGEQLAETLAGQVKREFLRAWAEAGEGR